MKNTGFFDTIHVDSYSATPKYLQLAYSILGAIKSGKFHKDLQLPSLNELTFNLDISRETADKGYQYLQDLGILSTIPGKGHYVAAADFKQDLRILLLINKLSDEKKIFYDAFIEKLGLQVPIDFYIYNNSFSLFKKLLAAKAEEYSHYVIIPHFIECQEEAEALIRTIPEEKLIVLDRQVTGIGADYGCVYEDFEKDLYKALEKMLARLSKYHTLNLVFPQKSYFSKNIIKGFNSFCLQYAFERNIISSVHDSEPAEGEVFICLTDEDLIELIEKLKLAGLKAGEQTGIISYNETPLKKYIMDGITTISTDYKAMGNLAAKMIVEDYRERVSLPFGVTMRSSL